MMPHLVGSELPQGYHGTPASALTSQSVELLAAGFTEIRQMIAEIAPLLALRPDNQ